MAPHGHHKPTLCLLQMLIWLLQNFIIHFCAVNSAVARGDHTYMACPGKAITPITNQYPEDIQFKATL